MTVYWKGGGGHVLTAERLKGGVLRLYDPQSGKIGSLSGGGGFGVFWRDMNPSYGFRVLKVDSLKLKSGFNLRRVAEENREK